MLRSSILAGAAILLALTSSARANEITEHPITCAESPIQFDFRVKSSSDDHCLKWTNKEMAHWGAYRWEQFHRYEEFDLSFINVRYLRAGRRSYLSWYELEKQIKMRFEKAERDSFDWHDTVKVRVRNREFDTRDFKLPKDLACTGFVIRWGHFSEGYTNILVGYICGENHKIPLEEVTELLSDISLE